MPPEREMEIRASVALTRYDRREPGDSPGEQIRDTLAAPDAEREKAARLERERDELLAQITELNEEALKVEAQLAATLRERDALAAKLDEREGDMHARIRAEYDRTIADAWRAANARMADERDTLAAALVEVRKHAVSVSSCLAEAEIGGHEGDEESGCHDEDCQACAIEATRAACDALDAALSALPADLVAARDALVGAEALEEAADAFDGGIATHCGDWLRARAEEKRGAR